MIKYATMFKALSHLLYLKSSGLEKKTPILALCLLVKLDTTQFPKIIVQERKKANIGFMFLAEIRNLSFKDGHGTQKKLLLEFY